MHHILHLYLKKFYLLQVYFVHLKAKFYKCQFLHHRLGELFSHKLKAEKEDTERIKRIAIRDKGSLYVKIRPNGDGYVLDERLREDAMV